MNRPALLSLPPGLASWRGLAGRTGLAHPGSAGDTAGPASMFDSAGASGLTVELPEASEDADALHAHLASSPEVAAMLIIDPAGLWAPGVMQALADATGSPVDRLRVHGRHGTQVRAVVDETLLPAGSGPHRLVRCVHGHARLADRRDVYGPLLAHSQVCAVLVGPMPTAEAQALIDDVRALAASPEGASVRWLVWLTADHRALEARLDVRRWPAPPTVLHGRPLARSVSAVWNALYAAWIAA